MTICDSIQWETNLTAHQGHQARSRSLWLGCRHYLPVTGFRRAGRRSGPGHKRRHQSVWRRQTETYLRCCEQQQRRQLQESIPGHAVRRNLHPRLRRARRLNLGPQPDSRGRRRELCHSRHRHPVLLGWKGAEVWDLVRNPDSGRDSG